jgi:pyridoxal phosphate enzyme (YggS family)
MHISVQNLLNIQKNIKSKFDFYQRIKIIAVSKTHSFEQIKPLIDHGHIDFGENKVQEAIEKWTEIKNKNTKIKLHLIGKLQTNKVKLAVKIFDYIHSVDNEKLAKKISEEQIKNNKNIKIFIQVNIGDEIQKSGIRKDKVNDYYKYCLSLKLDVQGLMCIPPEGQNSDRFFKDLKFLNDNLGLKKLSMGMSSDYISAIENSATHVRIGSSIFGKRS